MRFNRIQAIGMAGIALLLIFGVVQSFAQSPFENDDTLAPSSRVNMRRPHTIKSGVPGTPESRKAAANALKSAAHRSFSFAFLKKGDAIRIIVYPDSASFINGIYQIGPDNDIVLPLLGRTKIGGMTENEFVDFINKAFVDQMRYPNAQVQPLIRLSFLGGFHEPGLLYVNPTLSLWDAVRQTGGPLREDGFDRMKWERKGEIIAASLRPGLESGESLYELGFQSGDLIEVTPKPKQYFWDKMNSNVFPGMTFLVTSVTASIAVYSTFRLLSEK